MESVEAISDKRTGEIYLMVNFNALPIKLYDGFEDAHRFSVSDCLTIKQGLGDGTIVATVVCLQESLERIVNERMNKFNMQNDHYKALGTFTDGFVLPRGTPLTIENVHRHIDLLKEFKSSFESNSSMFPTISAEMEKSVTMMAETPELLELAVPMGYSGLVKIKGDIVVDPVITKICYEPDYVKNLSRTILKKTLENYIRAYPFRKDDMLRKKSKNLKLDDLQVAMNSDMTIVTDVFCTYFFQTNDPDCVFNLSVDFNLTNDGINVTYNGIPFIDLPADIKKMFNMEATIMATPVATRVSKHGDWLKEYESIISLIIQLTLRGYIIDTSPNLSNIMNEIRKYVTIVIRQGAPVSASSINMLVKQVFSVNNGSSDLPDEDDICLFSDLVAVLAGFPGGDNTIAMKKDFSQDAAAMIEVISRYV